MQKVEWDIFLVALTHCDLVINYFFVLQGGSLKDAQTIIEWQTKIDESSTILAYQSQA